MNKGGVGLGGGACGGSGPTAAAAAGAAQKQKTLLHRGDTVIENLVDNFGFLGVGRVSDPPVRNSQESFVMVMRDARMVQAADSMLKLVSELKQTASFSGSASLNDHVDGRTGIIIVVCTLISTILGSVA